MSESALIRVEHLTRYYGQHCALHDVSFTVGRGEVLGLLGPNGAGKSPTMQILSGNLAPSAGAVWINGIDLLDRPKAAKASLGYLPDAPPVVILDEPTVGLDPLQMREIRALIRELRDEHSVILSTHILPEVQAVCDRVQIISAGKLVFNDTIEGLQRRMHASSLIVGLRRPPEVSALQGIAGVESVDVIEPGRYRLHYLPERSPAETLATQAVAGEWGLYELAPERMSFEQVFVDITRNDPTETEAAACPFASRCSSCADCSSRRSHGACSRWSNSSSPISFFL